jgi:hypothetical protein
VTWPVVFSLIRNVMVGILSQIYNQVSDNIDQYLLLYMSLLFFVCGIIFLISPTRSTFLDWAFTFREFVIAGWSFLIFLVLYVQLPGDTKYWRIGIRVVVSLSVTLVFIGLIRKVILHWKIEQEMEALREQEHLQEFKVFREEEHVEYIREGTDALNDSSDCHEAL